MARLARRRDAWLLALASTFIGSLVLVVGVVGFEMLAGDLVVTEFGKPASDSQRYTALLRVVLLLIYVIGLGTTAVAARHLAHRRGLGRARALTITAMAAVTIGAVVAFPAVEFLNACNLGEALFLSDVSC